MLIHPARGQVLFVRTVRLKYRDPMSFWTVGRCLSLTFRCLALTFRCLSLTFRCLSMTFCFLALTFRCLFRCPQVVGGVISVSILMGSIYSDLEPGDVRNRISGIAMYILEPGG